MCRGNLFFPGFALAVVFSVLVAAEPTAPGNGPVGGYAFDEGSGTITIDASGNGNTGTLTGALWTGSGKHGPAVSFNGSSGSITVAASSSLNITGSFTLSAWIKPATLSGYQTILIKETSGSGSYWLQTLGNQVDSGIFDGATFHEHVTPTANLAINIWYHLASVFDNVNQTFTIYVNGASALSESENGTMLTNAQNFVFGQSHAGERWNGLVDDVRIYDRALSQAEIQSDMNTPVGGSSPPLDTTPPTVSIISPASVSTVWGVTTLSAIAKDPDSGIAGVKFRLDGADIDAEVAGPPYNFAWNTTTVAPGNHTLTAVARNGSSLTSTSNPVTVTVTTAPARLLKKSANGRYLVNQNNVPFLITGDAPQSLTVNISTNEANLYLADRQFHGFNALWVNLLCNDGTAGRVDGSTYDGILPFDGYLAGHSNDPNFYDLSTPDSSYFARCDWMINQAAKYGFVVFLNPIETIGWLRNEGNGVLLNSGTNACRAYGQYLGNRYKGFTNIVWMSGNDFQTWPDLNADAVVTAVALGIRDADTNHIHAVELNFLSSGSLDDTNWAPIISLNASYTYFPTYAQVLNDYNRTNFLPVFLVEANYEFENLQGPVTTAPILRRQEYWTILSGATGQLYGNFYTWTFSGGWQSFLNSPGALQMPNVKALFEPRAWYKLVPDQTHSVLTAGYGTFSSTGFVADNDYATAARTPDGSLVIVYMPTLRTISVDMTQLAGPATARWYDPSSGAYLSIAGSPFSNTGTRDFIPPGNNADGDGDWVLVLETSPTPPAVTRIVVTGNDSVISFTTLGNMAYDLQSAANLTSGVWSAVATNVPGTGGIIQLTDPGAASQSLRFYRVKLPL